MTAAMQKLANDVAAQTTVVQSAVTAFNGIAQQIAAIDDPEAQTLAAQVEAATAQLAAAIPVNTPAAPAPVPAA